MIEQSADVSNDKWFQSWITEMIVNEVIKVINDRADPYKDLESSKHQMKTSNYGDDEASDSVVLEGGINEKKQVAYQTLSENCTCYPSSIDFGVHINNTPVSKSSKQGEGDYQPILRETTAFYHLRNERNVLNNQDASTSSLLAEQSDNELIESLQNNIDALSFDNVQLSESEFESDAQCSPFHETKHNENYFESCSLPDVDQSDNNNYTHDEESIKKYNCNDIHLRNSHKFCQVNATHYFPSDPNLPHDYFQIVNDNYEQYMLMTAKEGEEQELLSGSSQELWIIESENINSDEDSCNTNLFNCNNKQESAVNGSLNCPIISQTKKPGEFLNWEEEAEVQVNVTEPVQTVQTDFLHDTEISPEVNTKEYTEDNSIITSRTYWSNVGIMAEHQIARDYLGPTPEDVGFESIKNVRKVESKYLGSNRYSDQQLLAVNPQDQEQTIIDRSLTLERSNNDSINYLSLSKKSKESNQKKKKNIVFRISGVLSNIFSKSRKNKPASSNAPPRSKDATN